MNETPPMAWTAEQARDAALYTGGDAAKLVGVGAQTIRKWALGADGFRPLIAPAGEDSRGAYLSFTNVIELFVARHCRLGGMKIARLRGGIEALKESSGIPRPLAHPDLQAHGQGLFLLPDGETVVTSFSEGGQRIDLELVGDSFERIERNEAGVPTKLYPRMRSKDSRLICVDPTVAFGRPILDESGIRVDVLHARWRGGEPLREIAEDFDLSWDLIDEAIWWFDGNGRSTAA